MSLEFKKSGFVYQVATLFQERNGYEKDYHNACELFGDFFRCGLGMVAIFALGALCFIVTLPFGFLTGRRMPVREEEFDTARETGDLLVPYANWPRFYGHRVYPIVIIALAVLWWGLLSLVEFVLLNAALIYAWFEPFLAYGVFGFGALAALALLCLGIYRFFKTEFWVLTKANIVGFFRGVCFEVKIVD